MDETRHYQDVELENGATFKYEINDALFSLKYLTFSFSYRNGKSYIVENGFLYQENEPMRDKILLYNVKHKDIKIILNNYNSGYEIQYK